MKKLTALLLAVVMTLALVGCGSTSTSGTAAAPTKDTVTMLGNYALTSLDPVSNASFEGTYLYNVWANLCQYDKDGKVAPMIAEKWEMDDTSCTFYIRKDVKFSDGSSITADDVVYTLECLKENPQYAAFWINYITSWEKVDDYTVKVIKAFPYVDVPGLFAYSVPIVCKAAREADPEAYGKMPSAVSGAYVPTTLDGDGTLHCTANTNFFEPVNFKNFVIKAPIDSATAAVALENKEVDIVTNLPVEVMDSLKGNSAITTASGNASGDYLMIFTGEKLKNDDNLRKAMFHAVNVKNMLLVTEGGQGTAAVGMRPGNIVAQCPNTYDYVGYDLDMAKDYLAKSNYDGSYEFTITVGSPLAATMAQCVQSDLNAIGVKSKVEQLDANNWATKVLSGQAEINIQAFFYGGFSQPESDWGFFTSTAPYYGMYMAPSKELDNLVTAIQTETDAAKRTADVQQINEVAYNMANYVPLYDIVNRVAQTNDISAIPAYMYNGAGAIRAYSLTPAV